MKDTCLMLIWSLWNESFLFRTLYIQCTKEKRAIDVRFKQHFAINIREY